MSIARQYSVKDVEALTLEDRVRALEAAVTELRRPAVLGTPVEGRDRKARFDRAEYQRAYMRRYMAERRARAKEGGA